MAESQPSASVHHGTSRKKQSDLLMWRKADLYLICSSLLFDPLRTFAIVKASGRDRAGRGGRLSPKSLVRASVLWPNGGLLPAGHARVSK